MSKGWKYKITWHQRSHWKSLPRNLQGSTSREVVFVLPLDPGFEFCVKGDHSLPNFPPMNDKTKTKNQVAKTKYFDLVTHMSEFKAGSRDDLPRDEKGKEIKKIQAPIINHDVISCKCHQNKPDTCQFQCKYKGKQYEFSDCPICCSNCKFLCTVIDFV